MKTLILLLIVLAASAQAQSVSVKSGEHGTFSRLVLTFPTQVDWVLGRTPQGYGLQIPGAALPFDVSSVYQRITKDRLRSIWVDPENGDLMLGIECACHAIPFEFAPRILVIDIKDGPPPQNSSFELLLQGGMRASPIQSAVQPRPRQSSRNGTYNWLDQSSMAAGEGSSSPAGEVTKLDNDLQLQDFRTMLIEEIGRGATQGLVEMERPNPSRAETPLENRPENARAGIGALPGIGISFDKVGRADLTVLGESCPNTADLDIGRWAIGADAGSELARARAMMLTEFDVPEPDLVLKAIDTHLYFGFGAEARLMQSSFLPSARKDAFRLGLSYLIDGDSLSPNSFEGMQSCDSAAALWALLAAPGDKVLAHINGAAVSRTFLSLPPHLRVQLGPETTLRLLKSGDSANSEVVAQSFERAAPSDDNAVMLLRADQALENGDPVAAEAILPSATSGETAVTALLSLVEARFQMRKPVEGKDLVALEAFAFEHGKGPLQPQLDRARSHGAALGGDFASAFERADGIPALERDIWMLLGEIGAESQLLLFAVGADPTQRAELPVAIRAKIAERLLDAGLPNAASDWAPRDEVDTDLAARVALANGDARSALRLMTADLAGADPDLMAAAYTALGDYAGAATVHRDAGDVSAAQRAQRWAREWPDALVPPTGEPTSPRSDSWTEVTMFLDQTGDRIPAPPLQASLSQLEQSAATRQAIAALLSSTPMVSEE